MKELEVVGVRLEVPSSQPVVLLREIGTQRHLPIWVGTPEATSIALAQEGVAPPRPLTHDLFLSLLRELNEQFESVHITNVDDGVFYATINLASGLELDARPSDAIAIALRSGAPVFASETLLETAGVQIDDQVTAGPEDDGAAAAADRPPVAEEELQKFREFLADVTPEDFEGPQNPPSGGLS